MLQFSCFDYQEFHKTSLSPVHDTVLRSCWVAWKSMKSSLLSWLTRSWDFGFVYFVGLGRSNINLSSYWFWCLIICQMMSYGCSCPRLNNWKGDRSGYVWKYCIVWKWVSLQGDNVNAVVGWVYSTLCLASERDISYLENVKVLYSRDYQKKVYRTLFFIAAGSHHWWLFGERTRMLVRVGLLG